LFNGNWIRLNNVLYQYNDDYYEEKETVIIKKQIVNWCANYIDEKGKKSKANPTSVENIFKWVNALFGVSPSQVNCEGIPLKNDYLALIKDENNNPKFELKPYSPDVYFTYQSEVN
jgi:phage/plasmid-associated DNA primase